MKKVAMALVLSSSLSAFAQGTLSTSRSAVAPDESQKGFYVGADYMNVTDVHAKTSAKVSDGSVENFSYEGGMQLGMAGVTLGYNQTPEFGFGFRGGIRILQSINKSETGDDTIQMFIPEINGTLAIHKMVALYAGLSTAVWSGTEYIRRYKSGLGGQLGMTGRFTKNIALNAGYTIMTEKLFVDDELGNRNIDLQASGFNSSLVYTF